MTAPENIPVQDATMPVITINPPTPDILFVVISTLVGLAILLALI
jgi:hypothetical protein